MRTLVRRLLWLGPVTVAASVLAVTVVHVVAVAVLRPPPEFLVQNYGAPAVFTIVLVAVAVVVFAVVWRFAANPIPTYRRIAFAALILSFGPDIPIGLGWAPGGDWPLAIVFMAMHVAAWAATVMMLTRWVPIRSEGALSGRGGAAPTTPVSV